MENPLADLIQVLEKHSIFHTVKFDFAKKEKYIYFDDYDTQGRATIVFNYDGNFIGIEVTN